MPFLLSHTPALLDWLRRTSWQVAVLVLLVLLLQWVCRAHLWPRWRYRLWLLVIVRLILPVSPSSPLSIFNLIPPPPAPLPPAAVSVPAVEESAPLLVHLSSASIPAPAPPQTPPGRLSLPVPWEHILAGIWLGGALLLVGGALWSNLVFLRRLGRLHPTADPRLRTLLDRCRQELGVARQLPLVITNLVHAPALAGLWHPRLLLPPAVVQDLNDRQLHYVLLHELAHFKCRDIAADWFLTLVQALHWCNPFVWLALSRCRADRELVRDLMVLQVIRGQEEDYGRTILRLVQQLGRLRPRLGTVAIVEGKRQLRRRIRLIAGAHRTIAGGAVLAVLLMLIVASLTLTDRTRHAPPTPPSLGQDRADSLASEPLPLAPNPIATTGPANLPVLLCRRLAKFDLDQTRFEDAIAHLEQRSGIRMSVNWAQLTKLGISQDTPVTAHLHSVPVSKAIMVLLQRAGSPTAKPAYDIGDSGLVISTADDLNAQRITCTYPAADIVARAAPGQMDQVIHLIKLPITSDLEISLRFESGRLVALASHKDQLEIRGAVEALRQRLQGRLVETPLQRVTVDFDHAPFVEVVSRLQTLSGGHIEVDWPSLETVGIGKATPITAHLRYKADLEEALWTILPPATGTQSLLGYGVYGDNYNQYKISTLNHLPDEGVRCTRVYDVRALVAERASDSQAADKERPAGPLISFLEHGLPQDTKAKFQFLSGQMIVTSSWKGQTWVHYTLDHLRPQDVGQQSQPAAMPTPAPIASLEPIIHVYDARDLVVDWSPEFGTQTPPVAARAQRVAALIRLIKDTVAPASWTSGGSILERQGEFIVSNSAENQAQIAALLSILRQTHGLQILAEGTLATVDPDTVGKVSQMLNDWAAIIVKPVGSPPVEAWLLDEEQASQVLELVRASSASSVLLNPRVVAFNGQQASISQTTDQAYTTDYKMGKNAAGESTFTPQRTVLRPGTVFAITGFSGQDRRYVTLRLDISLTRIEAVGKAPCKDSPPGRPLFVEQPAVHVTQLSTITDVPAGEVLLVIGPPDPKQTRPEQLLLAIKPTLLVDDHN